MTREKAENIVNDFFKEMNPTFWNGKGNKPQTFKEQIWEFDLTDNISLEITFAQDGNEWNETIYRCYAREGKKMF